MFGASQAVLLGAAGCVHRGYDATVAGIPGLLAYWRFSDTSGVIDATTGGRHGTYDGTVSLVPGLPTASDAASHMAGNVVGTVPHDPGLLLPAFTLSFWVELVEMPSDVNWYFITKDRSGLFDGDFGVRFTNQAELNARFQTADEGSAPGATFQAEVGRSYHVAVSAGAHGLSMWVDGKLFDTDETYRGGWSQNTEPLLFAGTQFNQFVANIILDEVALYSRVLADSEIIALSQRTAPPVAVADSGEAQAATTAVLDIVANDTWIGRRENLAIEIVSPPAFGAISVRGDKTIEFAASSVEQAEADSFTYRIQDQNGQSNVATVNVTVQAAADQPPGDIAGLNPLCYVESNADTVVVNSAAALASAINSAPPGRNILVAPGTYSGGTHTLTANGTVNNPVVVRAQNGTGTVTFNGAQWTINGSGLVLSRLYFNNAGIDIDGGAARIRITRCRFRQVTRRTIMLFACVDTRIDHCDFSDYVSSTSSKGFVIFRHTNVGNGTMRRVLLDHNYSHDVATTEGVNGSELFFSTSSGGGSQSAFPQVVMDHCLFRNIGPVPGEGEVLGCKHSGTHVQFCTFEGSTSMYFNMPRNGSEWTVRSCWFEGLRNPFIMVACLKSTVIGCRFIGGMHLAIHAGNSNGDYWTLGQPNGGFHWPADRTKIIGNVLDTGQLRVGSYWSNNADDTPTRNTLVAGNIRNGAPATTSNGISLQRQINTTIDTTVPSEYVGTYTVASKLTPAMVGLSAPDPHCPNGPQS